ncbi:MAG: SpoIIE family protein phosphatase [Planctomycetota bacterium]
MADVSDNVEDLGQRVAELEAERRTLLDILDLAPFYVYAIDERGHYRFANRAVAEDLGHTPRSIVGVRWQDIVPNRDQAEALLRLIPGKIEAGEPVITRDVPLYLNATGEDAIIDLYEAPFRDADGKDWLLGIARDRTDEIELERARVERAKLDRDLSIARTIQRSLLPDTPPARSDLDVAGWSRPADDTGGDFYDWFTTPDGTTYVLLGDVTGHGVGPALIAATARAYARAAKLNALLTDELPVEIFVTLAVAQIPPDRAAARYLSAGHGPTYFRAADRFGGGSVELLDSHGPPMGILPDVVYEASTPIPLLAGARFVLASDGLPETADGSGTLLGAGPIAESLHSAPPNADGVLQTIRSLADTHAGDQPQSDDMTAVAVLGGERMR